MKISSKELAQMLGVSPSAISIALNGKKGISEETRKEILLAAEKYGLKRPIRKQAKNRFVNLVIYKKHGLVYGDTDFFSSVVEGISAYAAGNDMSLQVTYFYGNQNIQEQINMLRRSECSGIILLATEMMGSDIEIFRTLPQPMVVLDSYFDHYNFDYIVLNNVQGAYLATKHISDAGHRDIGYLCSKVPINNFNERCEGFNKAIAEVPGCRVTQVPVLSTQDGAYQDMCAYIETRPHMPTAFFADNDIIAISCLRALKDHGYRVPDEISFVGFDDLPMCSIIAPRLTTVSVPKEQFGQRAIMRLIEKIQNPDAASLTISVNTSLVVRDSVKVLSLGNEETQIHG